MEQQFLIRGILGFLLIGQVSLAQSNNTVSLTASGFSAPVGLTLGTNQDVFVSDSNYGAIYRVSANGSVEIQAQGFAGPHGVILDKAGNMYVADAKDDIVYKVDSKGQVITLADNLQNPSCLGFDPKGNLLVSHELADGKHAGSSLHDGAITRISLNGGRTLVASGFLNPQGLLVDADNNIIVAAEGFAAGAGTKTPSVLYSSGLFKIDSNGQVTLFIDLGTIKPSGLALGLQGTLFFSGTQEGQGFLYSASSNGTLQALLMGLNQPRDIAANSNSLFVADESAGQVWRLSLGTNVSLNELKGAAKVQPGGTKQSSSVPSVGSSTLNDEDAAALETDNQWGYHGKPDYSKIPVTPEGVPTAPPGVTAIIGRILRPDDVPLANYTVRLAKKATRTNTSGYFMLTAVPSGNQVLMYDGRSADVGDIHYPIFLFAWFLKAKDANVLPFTHYFPILDTAHTTKIDPSRETVHKTPLIPNMEIHIPPHTKIVSVDGTPVTSITTTALGENGKTPFPMGMVRTEGGVFTLQPGFSVASQTVRIIYNNHMNYPPHTRVQLTRYDPFTVGWWTQYGMGTVTADRKQIVPDPGVGITRFSCSFGNQGAGNINNSSSSKEPVDLATGVFWMEATDLTVPGLKPLALTRSYRGQDSNVRPMGIGTIDSFDIRLYGDRLSPGFNFDFIDLVLPNDSSYRFAYQTNSPNLTYVSTNDFRFAGAKIIVVSSSTFPTDNGFNFYAQMKDGTSYGFDGCGALREIRDRNSNFINVDRTSCGGNINRVTQPSGRYLSFTYDGNNLISKVTDSSGRSVSYGYDASKRLVAVTNAIGNVTQYGYDANNNLTNSVLPNGVTLVQNVYDVSNRVTRQVLADGGTFGFKYNTNGSGVITSTVVTNQNNNVTTYNFTNGFDSSIVDALGNTTTFVRRASDNALLRIIDPLSRTNSFGYDANGNVVAVTNAQGKVTTLTYEPNFNLLSSVTDPLSHTIGYGYDGRGNLTSITDALGKVTSIANNQLGLPTSVTDPLNNTYSFSYNEFFDLVTTTDPLGNKVTRSVDTLGRPIMVSDPLGRTTQKNYDALNRVTSLVDPSGSMTSFSYDSVGNLLSVTDANSHSVGYGYDSMNRLTSRTNQLSKVETYAYDKNGNVTNHVDRRGISIKLQYDALDRRTRADYGTESNVQLQYDKGNRVTNVLDSIAGTVRLTFDSLDRLTKEVNPNGTNNFTYNDGGLRTNLSMTGETAITYRYDAGNRLTNVVQGTTTASLAYDDDIRRTQLTLPNGIKVLYSYDSGSRLTNITYQAALTNKIDYEFFDDGNRYSLNSGLLKYNLPSAVTNSSYNAANQQLTYGGYTVTYDANGNATNIVTATTTNRIVWNARNQITNMTGSGTASFIHDGLGRRITRVVGSTTEKYHYDGADIMLQKSNSGTVQSRYFRGLGIDEPWQRIDVGGAGTNRIYLADALGSTAALTDTNKAIQTQYAYDPFGTTTTTISTNKNSYKYTGREEDGTGLYFYRGRYHHPALMRFISEDPIEYAGGDVNLYAYVGNNTVNLTDPFGLWSIQLGGYIGVGGSITIGKNPTYGRWNEGWLSSWFVGARGGVGAGGGFSFDMNGQSVGRCNDTNPYFYEGIESSLGAVIGPVSLSKESSVGTKVFYADGKAFTWRDYLELGKPTWSFKKWGFKPELSWTWGLGYVGGNHYPKPGRSESDCD